MSAQEDRRHIRARSGELLIGNAGGINYKYTMRDGVVFDDLLRPEYWAAEADTFGVGTGYDHTIEVFNPEKRFYARLYVTNVRPNEVEVTLLDGPKTWGEVELREDYQPEWNFGKKGYDIMRMSDKKIIHPAVKGGSKEQAQSWIDENIKTAA